MLVIIPKWVVFHLLFILKEPSIGVFFCKSGDVVKHSIVRAGVKETPS